MAAFDPLQTFVTGGYIEAHASWASLKKLYKDSGLSTVQIAERYGTHPPVVLRLMNEYRIARRSRGAGKT